MLLDLKGIIPAVVTPIDHHEKVKENSLRGLANYLISGGVHGLFIVGTSGEYYGFDRQDYRKIIDIVNDETRGKIPVYVGASAITTNKAIELTKIAEDSNADAVVVLTPMFVKPSQDELYLHYKLIAQSTSLPVILYNNCPKTGVNINAETVEKLASIDNIIGIKDSSGDFTLTVDYIRMTKDKNFKVIGGRDTHIYACLCHGGSGAISPTACIAPKVVMEIYDKYIAGDTEGALKAQLKIFPLRKAFSLGTFPAVLKEALNTIGIEAGPCMKPLNALSESAKKDLEIILKELGLID